MWRWGLPALKRTHSLLGNRCLERGWRWPSVLDQHTLRLFSTSRSREDNGFFTAASSPLERRTARVAVAEGSADSNNAPTEALEDLAAVFSEQNVYSESPSLRDPRSIQDMYRRSGSQLDASARSALISFFGTLSLPPDTQCEHANPLAQRAPASYYASWWTFVLDIFHDKRRWTRGSGTPLAESDLYWSFVAQRAIDPRRDSKATLHPDKLYQHFRSRKSPHWKSPDNVLSEILAQDNMLSETPAMRSANDMRKLYLSSQSSNNTISTEERSALIALFGTLSISPDVHNPFASSLAAHMPRQSHRPWWGFMWNLLQDQMESGVISSSDRFFSAAALASESRVPASSPLQNLQSKLSQLMSSDCSLRFQDAQSIQRLYFCAGQEVRLIGPEAFSFLITRFGMLSVSHTGTKRVGGNFSFRSNWSFVKTLVRDKQNTYDLSSRDLFWLVSACARANGLDSVLVDSDPSEDMRDARLRHLETFMEKRAGVGLEAYIESLLALNSRNATLEAIGWLSELLCRSPVSPSLRSTYWRMVLGAHITANDEFKDLILSVTHRCVHANMAARVASQSVAVLDEIGSYHDAPHKPPPTKAVDFLLGVSNEIFPHGSGHEGRSPSQIVVTDWSRYLAHTMFDQSYSISARWRNLMYLAFANAPSESLPQTLPMARLSTQDDGGQALHPVDTRVIVLLSILERVESVGRLSPEMYPFVHGLWNAWEKSICNNVTVHAVLVRPLLASFFALAGRMRADELRHSASNLTNTLSWVWAFDFGDDHARDQVRALVSEYIAASALCGHAVWEEIILRLPNYAVFPQWQPMLLGQALVKIARADPVLAVDLYGRWSAGVTIPQNSIASLCRALAESGRVDLAIPFLGKFSSGDAGSHSAFAAVLLPLAREKAPLNDTTTMQTLRQALHELSLGSTRVSLDYRGRIFWFLSLLIRSGNAPAAVTSLQNIWAKQPRYFTRRAVDRLFRSLLYRRHFKSVIELLERSKAAYPSEAISQWARMIVSSVRSAPLANRAAKLIDPSLVTRDRFLTLLTCVNRRHKKGRLLMLAGRLSRFRGSARTPAFFPALHALARTQGDRVFLKTLRRLTPHLPAPRRTAAGNVLLMYWAARRDLYIRKGTALDVLKETIGFTPDRVSLNILIKWTLRRLSQDLGSTRALFEMLVYDGHLPSKTRLPPSAAPELQATLMQCLKSVHGLPLSTKRHVVPLFKMFIKAFYSMGDAQAARTIVGMLKAVQAQEVYKGETMRLKRLVRKRKRGRK